MYSTAKMLHSRKVFFFLSNCNHNCEGINKLPLSEINEINKFKQKPTMKFQYCGLLLL